MHESEKWKWSRSVMSDSLRPHGLQPTRLLRPWDFPGKDTGVGCHCLLPLLARCQLNSTRQCNPGGKEFTQGKGTKLRATDALSSYAPSFILGIRQRAFANKHVLQKICILNQIIISLIKRCEILTVNSVNKTDVWFLLFTVVKIVFVQDSCHNS